MCQPVEYKYVALGDLRRDDVLRTVWAEYDLYVDGVLLATRINAPMIDSFINPRLKPGDVVVSVEGQRECRLDFQTYMAHFFDNMVFDRYYDKEKRAYLVWQAYHEQMKKERKDE